MPLTGLDGAPALHIFLATALVQFRLRFRELAQNELLVLLLVNVHAGISINELVAISAIPQPNMSRLLQALIYKGYVMRKEDQRKGDPRTYAHWLEPYAKRRIDAVLSEAAQDCIKQQAGVEERADGDDVA